MSLTTGTQLGRYLILSEIGRGGMAQVYRARDERLQRDVALKVLAEVTEGEEAVARFDREARAVASLSHPNILAIHDVGNDAGYWYAVTELLEGETLRQRLERGLLPATEAVDVGRQVLEGLAAAHARGIVHRDIKPENIFITVDGRVKILDFGIARMSAPLQPLIEGGNPGDFRTRTGVVLGTVSYMAPEQLGGSAVDHRADLFAFGCVLHEMLTGERPFGGATMMAIAANILNTEPRLEPLPHPYRPIVARALRKDPADRFPSADAMLEAIRTDRDAPRPSRSTMYAVAAAAIVVLLAAGAWVARNGSSEVAPAADTAALKAVAVLPFANLGGDPGDEYLSAGITDELINLLGRVEGLRIPGRTSSLEFRGERVNLSDVGSRLNVQHAIEGSVQRNGPMIRVRAQLVSVPEGVQLWSRSYDEPITDLLAVQERIARDIVQGLGLGGRPSGVTPASSAGVDPEAHRLYLRGRHVVDRWTGETFEQALAYYRAAIQRDAGYAAAYAGLADLYSFMDHRTELAGQDPVENYRLGIVYGEKALSLDPQSAEAHAALGHIYVHTGDFRKAEHHLGEATRINPNSSAAHMWQSMLLELLGRSDEAIVARRKAVQLDPLSLQTSVLAVSGAWRAGATEQALEIGEAGTRLIANPGDLWGALSRVYALVGRFDDAHRALERAAQGRPLRILESHRAFVLALEGRTREARELLTGIGNDPQRNPGAIALMRGWAAAGDVNRAIEWMKRAVEESPEYARVNIDVPPHPAYAELRAHPRYIEGRRQLGLPK